MSCNVVTVLDNGAYSAKIGNSFLKTPRIIPNCTMKARSERRRPFIGDQIDECRDASGLFYILCFQRGYLVNFDVQKTVWDYMFGPDCCNVNFSDPFIVTEPQFNFTSIQETMTEIFFEEYESETLLRITAADLCAYNYCNTEKFSHKTSSGPTVTEELEPDSESQQLIPTVGSSKNKPLACVVVDMGYSFTYIVPFIKGKRVKNAIRRIDVGGKVLTNHLKEIISYRQLNVMDESYVINQVKEDSCFVSTIFMDDMKLAKKKYPENTIVRDYVLPDFTTLRRGFLREPGNYGDDQQTLRLTNERFVIPELLFHPSDVGIQQMGVAEAILNSVNSCEIEEAIPHLLANIVVVGGCAEFPGMQERLQNEVRALTQNDIDVEVHIPKNPIAYGWEGGVKISKDPEFLSFCMTREEYEEEGMRCAFDRFDV